MEKAQDYEDFRSKVIEEFNLLRTNPQMYANKVRKYATYFKGKVLQIPGGDNIMTQEGPDAYEEAAKFLDNFTKVDALTYNPGLTHAAHDFLTAVSTLETDKMGELNLESYIEKHGEVEGHLGLSNDFGSNIPELVIINLVVDDGDAKRGNRNNILDGKFKQIGVAKGSHTVYQHCTVIFYAQNFKTSKETEEIEKKLSLLKLAAKEKKVVADDDDWSVPEGYVKVDKSEKIVEEGGVKKKIIKIVKHKEDGTVETELRKENVN